MLNFAHLILEYILKCGYIIHYFNAHFLLYIFDNKLLLAVCFIYILSVCFICILNDARQKTNLNFCSSSKWVIKLQRQLTSSTMHLTQELFINVQGGGSTGSAKDTAAGCGKPTVTSWEQVSELTLLRLLEKGPENSAPTMLQSSGPEANWEGEKAH